MSFDKKEYDRKFSAERRKTLKQFKVDLPAAEKEELDILLEQHNLTKTEFLKKSILNFKEELKMKKYYIYCGTDAYRRSGANWEFDGNTSMNVNDKYIGVYDSYEQAIEIYNSINLTRNEESTRLYADYKQLYEFDTNDITDEDIEDDDLDIDKMKLLKEEYTF